MKGLIVIEQALASREQKTGGAVCSNGEKGGLANDKSMNARETNGY